MFCGGKEKFFFKTKLSLPPFHFAACLHKQRQKGELRPQFNLKDTAVYRYPSIIEKLRNKLSKTG